MLRFEDEQLWSEIDKLARASSSKSAAIAYFTDNKIGLTTGDRLITDASDRAIRGHHTDRALLRALHNKGVKLYSFSGLHAKVMIFDATVVVGSMNSSDSSRSKLLEAGLFSDDSKTVNRARQFIESLVANGETIDSDFLKRIFKLKLAPRKPVPISQKETVLKNTRREPRTFIVGVCDASSESLSESDEEVFDTGMAQASEQLSEDGKGISSFWLTGYYKIRKHARPGDQVIQMWAQSQESKSVSVYPPVPIRHIEQAGKRTWFYVEDWADLEERKLSWRKFKQLAAKARLTKRGQPIARSSVWQLSKSQYERLMAA